ncbi:MAG: tRNA guanosine(34) transglycosylase Tgt [Verrucomicrobiae bacterium]|nr:tRNA guanosine(34) transglycosylase Tgt [Verrucomicrobiae bacterium]
MPPAPIRSKRLAFQVEATAESSRARAGRMQTLHNVVETPVFMPVGTHAAVRHIRREDLLLADAPILLANTYHLLLRPGPDVFSHFGGIHQFMKWPRSVLTDSGGFQIFSLAQARKMTEEGATFKSHIDGRTFLLSPESSIATQRAIGSDIMMVLDECVPSTVGIARAREAMELTHRWAARSLTARGDSPQSLFGIVQGACDPDLRLESARTLTQMDFDGFAIGGLAVGEEKHQREDITALVAGLLPEDLPRYLMGVGTPLDLLEAVHRGVDMFDCIIPTAHAEQGVAYISQGRLRLNRGTYKFADETLDPACACHTCRAYSRAYLHHLVKAGEPLATQLIAHHNVFFYLNLMRDIRRSIVENRFIGFYNTWRTVLMADDPAYPINKPVKSRHKPWSLERGDYRVCPSERGHASIQQISSGEIMHSVNEPDQEARSLYLEQSRLVERALAPEGPEEIVVWDVGLGAGHNAMAVVLALEEQGPKPTRRVRLISFERDLDALHLALEHRGSFTHVRHTAPQELLKHNRWESPKTALVWELLPGDFHSQLSRAAAPDIIFYDPFSYRTDSRLWSPEGFTLLHGFLTAKCAQLLTYSSSTAVRATLLAAGFYVARGRGTGPKAETIAAYSLKPADPAELLDWRWLELWQKSNGRWPVMLAEADRPAFDQRVLDHPQFRQGL